MMAKRKRDYKAEYQRRKARAQREGFTGYSAKRTYRKAASQRAKTVADRLLQVMGSAMGIDDFDEFLQETDAAFWEFFRNFYGVTAAN